MNSDWKVLQIQNFAEVKSGKRLPKGHQLVSYKTNFPYIRLVDINDGKIQEENIRYLKKETRDVISRYIVNTNDICLAIVGHTIGMVFQVDGQWNNANLTENAARIINFSENIDNKFIYYYLISPRGQEKIISRKVGSAQGKLPLYNIKSLDIECPSIKTQRNIAHILSTLDNKIELNKKINQTLESIAQTIFKSWFVDFDPVHAKVNASSKDEYDVIAKELGISREILDLFPSEFENTELGVIPKGWEITPVSKISKLNSESWSHKKFPSVLNYIDLTSVKEGNITEISEYTYETAPSRARRILKRHDTIIGTVRPGNKSYAYINKEGLTGSTGFAVISPLKKHYRAFIYLYLTQENVIAHFAHIADGGAYPAIRPEIVTSLKLCMPTEDLLTAFQDKIAVLFDKISQNKEEQRILVKIRDMLLPKLISGEIEVSNLNLEPEYD